MPDAIYAPVLGVDTDANDEVAQFPLGHVITLNDKEFVYFKADAGGVAAAGEVVLLDEDYDGDLLDTTNSGSARGQAVGVAKAAVTALYHGWAQITGAANIQVAASCAANARLNSTGTAGQVDDDGTSGAEEIEGMVLTTANGAAAGTAAGFLTRPRVGVTL